MHILYAKAVAAPQARTGVVGLIEVLQAHGQKSGPAREDAFEPSQPFRGQELAEIVVQRLFHTTGRLLERLVVARQGHIDRSFRGAAGRQILRCPEDGGIRTLQSRTRCSQRPLCQGTTKTPDPSVCMADGNQASRGQTGIRQQERMGNLRP